MNRLWVRLSLAFVVVVLLSLCSIAVIGVTAYIQRDAGLAQAAQALGFPARIQINEPYQVILAASLVVIAILAIALGTLMSRSFTAPLNQLAAAAKRYAARDWSQRVPVRGAQEIVEVSTAFNQMADELEKQETLRRNLMADIAHELRTPLTVMQGNLRAMLDEMYPLDRAEIATLYDETRLLARLVDDLRELALADAGKLPLKLEAVNPNEILNTAAANFAIPADAQDVRFEPLGLINLPPVHADADRFAQVLRNLLANALQHTPAGGAITLGAARQNSALGVFVRDTGAGIEARDLPQVFDRFYRADKSRTRATGGTGLGLAITKAWVEAMGGKIGVESQEGQGSTFWFTLPLEKN
ncbi:MAG: HAMP domain-containing protein [Anaerolineae bacterium]|nr:HAMP domain-containing protein [Anaerolineae bacterium]